VILDELSVRETEALVAQTPKTPARTAIAPRQIDSEVWERDLTQRIGYRVTITSNKSGAGQLAIKFASLDQLEEIVGKLGPGPGAEPG
jgi:ParB family chromosome partitioning protein